jgi:hypothetical protein
MTDEKEFEKAMRRANKVNRKMVLQQSSALLTTVATMIEVVIKVETENMTLTPESMSRLNGVLIRTAASIEKLQEELRESEKET